jgi:hypothetical protein
MNEIVAQVVWGFGRMDIEDSGWMQILVFIIMVVIYVLGNIFKAKKVITERGEKESATGGSPKARQRLPVINEELQKEAVAEGRGTESKPAAVSGRVTIQPTFMDKIAEIIGKKLKVIAEQTGQVGELESVKSIKTTPKAIQIRPELKPRAPQPPDVMPKPVVEVEQKGVPIVAQAPVSVYLAEIISNYSDPDELRRAILHYEILGKPLSLRESPENTL